MADCLCGPGSRAPDRSQPLRLSGSLLSVHESCPVWGTGGLGWVKSVTSTSVLSRRWKNMPEQIMDSWWHMLILFGKTHNLMLLKTTTANLNHGLCWGRRWGPRRVGKSHSSFGRWEIYCMKLCLSCCISTSFLLFLLFMDPCPYEQRYAHCLSGSPHSGQSVQSFLGAVVFSPSLASRPSSAIISLT